MTRQKTFSSVVEQDTELQSLLAGCTDHWKLEFKDRKMTHWDARHWMSNMSSMLATPKGTPTSNLFGILLSDALFTILPGEYHRVKHYLLTQRNLFVCFVCICMCACVRMRTDMHILTKCVCFVCCVCICMCACVRMRIDMHILTHTKDADDRASRSKRRTRRAVFRL